MRKRTKEVTAKQNYNAARVGLTEGQVCLKSLLHPERIGNVRCSQFSGPK